MQGINPYGTIIFQNFKSLVCGSYISLKGRCIDLRCVACRLVTVRILCSLMERANHDQDLPNVLPLEPRGPIHRHCPKIYLKTCHQIILWQKLRCHKMLSRHILSQFTKFVWGGLKYSQDMMHCRSHYDISLFRFWLCIWYSHTHFTRSFRCLPTSVPPFDQAHNTAINVTSSGRRDGSLSALLIGCSTTHTGSSAALFYVLARTLYTSFVYTVWRSIVL